MAVRIRLKKMGRRHRPCYRIVAADSRAKRDGKVLEVLGQYDPLAKEQEKRVVFNRDRAQYWLGVGAKPSETVSGLLKQAGIK